MTGIHGAAQMVSSETDFSFIEKSLGLGGESSAIFDKIIFISKFQDGFICICSELAHIYPIFHHTGVQHCSTKVRKK